MSKDLPPSRTAEQFVVRLPEGMRDRIADTAKANGRSMNAEIVARLQASFDQPKMPDSAGISLGLLKRLNPSAQDVVIGLHGQLLETLAKLLLDELQKDQTLKLNSSDSSPPAPQSPPP